MEKHLATIEYIKDILEDDDLDITLKKVNTLSKKQMEN